MKKLASEYKGKSPIAVLPLTNFGGLGIFDVHYEYGESYVIVAFVNGSLLDNFRKHKIRCTKNLDQYFRRGCSTYYINEFMRV